MRRGRFKFSLAGLLKIKENKAHSSVLCFQFKQVGQIWSKTSGRDISFMQPSQTLHGADATGTIYEKLHGVLSPFMTKSRKGEREATSEGALSSPDAEKAKKKPHL